MLSAHLVLPEMTEEVSRKSEKIFHRSFRAKAIPFQRWPSRNPNPFRRHAAQSTDGGGFSLNAQPLLWKNSAAMDAASALDSTVGGRPNFLTTQWGLVAAASAEEATEARAAFGELYCLYCYPVYAFIRRRGYDRQDAQDVTQDFFVHLLEKDTLGRADPKRGK